MSKQISLTLPDELLRRAEFLAGRSGQDVADVLAEAIEASLDPLGFAAADPRPPTTWTDEQVLHAADATMSPIDEQALGELLDRQRGGGMTSDEQQKLRSLMQTYQEGLLHKAQGLHEAVRRGLRRAPSP